MEATDASAQPALDAKVLRKGLKARIPYLLAHKECVPRAHARAGR